MDELTQTQQNICTHPLTGESTGNYRMVIHGKAYTFNGLPCCADEYFGLLKGSEQQLTNTHT